MNIREELQTPVFLCSCGEETLNFTNEWEKHKKFGTAINVYCPFCGKEYYKDTDYSKLSTPKSGSNVLSTVITNTNTNMDTIVYNKPKCVVEDDGIYVPDQYAMRMILSREAFVEAYNKYIKD